MTKLAQNSPGREKANKGLFTAGNGRQSESRAGSEKTQEQQGQCLERQSVFPLVESLWWPLNPILPEI